MIFALWLLAVISNTTLGDYSALVRERVQRAIDSELHEDGAIDQVSGVVSMVTGEAAFLQGNTDALKVMFNSKVKTFPHTGDVITVKGQPLLEGGHVVFEATKWGKTGSAKLPQPIRVDETDLIAIGNDKSGINWRIVELEGRAIEPADGGFAMSVGNSPISVRMEPLPDFLKDCGTTRPKIKVKGVVEQVLDQSVLFGRGRYVMGVKLYVADLEDVELEPDVIYLVNRRDKRVRIAVTVAFTLLGLVVLVVLIVLYRQSRLQLKTKTLMGERKRMADDLHDTIEQHLVGAGMLLQLGRNKEARDILIRAKKEMRDIVWGLKNDDMMRLTPSEMVRELAKEETRKGICRVEARVPNLPNQMDAAMMRDLSLIIREAIGNAVKHGNAKKIAIASDPLPNGGWMLRIANNGKPFDFANAPGPAEGHFGLEGMRARARRIGAEIEFTVKGTSTVVIIRTMVEQRRNK